MVLVALTATALLTLLALCVVCAEVHNRRSNARAQARYFATARGWEDGHRLAWATAWEAYDQMAR